MLAWQYVNMLATRRLASPVSHSALNRVLLPTLGRPTMPGTCSGLRGMRVHDSRNIINSMPLSLALSHLAVGQTWVPKIEAW